MTELALNILDVANNSTRAKAALVKISILADTLKDSLDIVIADDGCGMSEELLSRVTDPFATTRTTRKVGMGIPLFKMETELAGGTFSIESKAGFGTTVKASFVLTHIDRPPLGDVASTITILIGGAPKTDFILDYTYNGENYIFDTRQVKEAIGENDLSDIEILNYLKEMINENLQTVNGGNIL